MSFSNGRMYLSRRFTECTLSERLSKRCAHSSLIPPLSQECSVHHVSFVVVNRALIMCAIGHLDTARVHWGCMGTSVTLLVHRSHTDATVDTRANVIKGIQRNVIQR